MDQICAAQQQFWGVTDDQTIQNAIDYAESIGANRVVIPRENARTGKPVWYFSKAVLLPSDITVVLDGCRIIHEEDTVDNLFRNRDCWEPEKEEQHDIRLIGRCGAVLDGGKGNGVCEQLCRENPGKYPAMVNNCAVHFSNVCRFEIRGVRFVQTRYWALCFHYCRWGTLAELDFANTGIYENQDGIDLRVGCEYITVRDITGITGDDTLALTALPESSFAKALRPAGRTVDIHDITIYNITASTHGCGVVRFLCESGARIYNVTAENIKDTTGSISGTAVIIGEPDPHFADPPHKMGDLKNIVLRNISTCAQRGIHLAEACQDILIENLFTYGPNEVGLRFMGNFCCDNLVIRNVCIRSHAETLDCVMSMPADPGRQLRGLKIENVRAASAKYVFRGTELPVEGLDADPPTQGWFTPEVKPLQSAYSRYHYAAWGKVFENRPKDNRFDGTLKTPEEMAK